MFQIVAWDIIRNAATVANDLISLAAVLSSGMIFLGGIIRAVTGRRPPLWTQRWEAALMSIIFGGIGLISKIGDTLPNGIIFQFSNFTVGLLLFLSILLIVGAFIVPRIIRTV